MPRSVLFIVLCFVIGVTHTEEKMTAGRLGVVLCVALVLAAHHVIAGDIAGKLERIGSNSVTLRVSKQQSMTLLVDRDLRQDAARYLGRTVMVRCKGEEGKYRAVQVGLHPSYATVGK